MTYDPTYSQLTSLTDPLGHVSSATYNGAESDQLVMVNLKRSSRLAFSLAMLSPNSPASG